MKYAVSICTVGYVIIKIKKLSSEIELLTHKINIRSYKHHLWKNPVKKKGRDNCPAQEEEKSVTICRQLLNHTANDRRR